MPAFNPPKATMLVIPILALKTTKMRLNFSGQQSFTAINAPKYVPLKLSIRSIRKKGSALRIAVKSIRSPE